MKGHVRKRGKSYELVVELGRHADGRRRQKTRTVRGTRKEADAELACWLHELNTGMYADPERMTVHDYLVRWLEDYARPNVAPSTYVRYEQIVRLDLVPNLGHLQMSKLLPMHIQRMLGELGKSKQAAVEGGPRARSLASRTVLHTYRVLHAALEQAVRWQVLPRNPADVVRPPRADRPEMQVLDAQETAGLLRAAEGTRLYMPILLAATTGMRRGEILALRWKDVDQERGYCAVRQAVSSTKEAGLQMRPPKTQKSRRTIALPLSTVQALREHRRAQSVARLSIGPLYQDLDLVCCREDGGIWHPDTFTSAWRKLRKEQGVTVRFHDLRHGHASQLLRLDVHPKIVSERLGHSTVALTLDTYSHVLPGMQEDAATRLEEALRGAGMGASVGR